MRSHSILVRRVMKVAGLMKNAKGDLASVEGVWEVMRSEAKTKA